MIRQLFVQVVPEVPADTQPIGGHPDQFPLGADPLEKHHQLEFEEDLRIDGRSPTFLIGTADQVTDEVQVELGLEVPIEVVGRHQILDGAIAERNEGSCLGAHHGAALGQR
jgi:hypothetical protein